MNRSSMPRLPDPDNEKSKAYIHHNNAAPLAASTPFSNQRVLLVVTLCFACFVCGEFVFAIAGHSLSLLGDAAAMSVDVFSYLTNMIAEHIKSKGQSGQGSDGGGGGGGLSVRVRFLLEVAVPCFSVSCLLVVTGWITRLDRRRLGVGLELNG